MTFLWRSFCTGCVPLLWEMCLGLGCGVHRRFSNAFGDGGGGSSLRATKHRDGRLVYLYLRTVSAKYLALGKVLGTWAVECSGGVSEIADSQTPEVRVKRKKEKGAPYQLEHPYGWKWMVSSAANRVVGPIVCRG
ncbi:hypothetical protein LZ30DRAFT_684201 [Colletotrichum cereale]|nr:hypothetical protein LZ30DRAFT_684201 [Colletotrichum cereale]